MTNIDFLDNDNFEDIQEVIGEYHVTVGQKRVKVRITLDRNGYYQMSTSHFYHGSNQAGPYITSAANFKTEKEALMSAQRQIASFYDSNDKNAKWIENEFY